jgi:hypothetical protein
VHEHPVAQVEPQARSVVGEDDPDQERLTSTTALACAVCVLAERPSKGA